MSDDLKPDTTRKTHTANTVIGENTVITGNVSGNDDIIAYGTVEGDINLSKSSFFIEESGKINANVVARNISVEGEVRGELHASEQIHIKSSGRVTGDIKAPRVVLDDGCQFKGLVDMEESRSADSRNSKLKLPRTKLNRPALKKDPDRSE